MATQAKFFEMPIPFERELWRVHGRYLTAHGQDLSKEEKKLAEKLGWFMWDMGDWLLEGEKGLSRKQLRQEAQKICPHRAWQTLKNWKITARAIESSRRRDGREGRRSLEYSLHKEVEKFDPDLQEELLAVADERPYTVNEFRAYVKTRHKFNGMLLPNTKTGTVAVLQDQMKWVNVKVRLKKAQYAFLRAINGGLPAHFLAELVIRNYIEANFETLMSIAVEHDERWGNVPRGAVVSAASYELTNRRHVLPLVQPDHDYHARREAVKVHLERSVEQGRAESKLAEEKGKQVREEEAAARKAAGLPIRSEYDDFYKRLEKIAKSLVELTGDKDARRNLLVPYVLHTLGIPTMGGIYVLKVPCQQWEALLVPLEAAGTQEAILKILTEVPR